VIEPMIAQFCLLKDKGRKSQSPFFSPFYLESMAKCQSGFCCKVSLQDNIAIVAMLVFNGTP